MRKVVKFLLVKNNLVKVIYFISTFVSTFNFKLKGGLFKLKIMP